jgi:soluble lytic murein transglycosylase
MDDRARVGRQLLQALTQKYAGDPAKAWAAYDAGEGNVDKALADAAITGNPSNWMSELAKYQSPTNHQQTVDYVNKNVSALESGGGMPSRPTLQDYHDAARAQVTQIYGANPPMGVLKQTLDAATKRFEDTSKALTAQGDNAVLQAQQWIISNNGDFTKLPSDMRTAVTTYSPGKMDDLMKFAKAISRGDNETNMGAYNFAVDHPEQLAQMSPAEFLQFQKTNFSSSDQEKIEKMRANELNGQTDDSSGALNNKAFTAVVNNRLQSIGIPLPTGAKDVDNAQRVGTIKKYLADGIYSQQQQLGRKMVPKEISDYVDGVMSKDVNFQNTFLGFNTGASSQKMLTMTVNDIPTDSLNAIRQGLAARGQPNPSNDTILRSYWTWKNAKR